MSFPCKAEHLKHGYRIQIGHLKSAHLVKGVSTWMAVVVTYCDIKSGDIHMRLASPGGNRLLLRVPPDTYFRTEKTDAPRPVG